MEEADQGHVVGARRGELHEIHLVLAKQPATDLGALPRLLREQPQRFPIPGVHENARAGLGILQLENAHGRQLHLPRIRQGEGDEIVPAARREVADWSDFADERVFRSELRQRVMSAILDLPAIYRAPVMLRDIQGLSTEEASAMLRVKDQTLKSRLHRGRLILRKQLADFAGGLSLHRPIYGT